MYKKFIEWARQNQWDVAEKKYKNLNLNYKFKSRYPEIPMIYIEFLKTVDAIISPNQTKWFLCENNYNETSNLGFKWNEFELLSLEAAKGDEEWQFEIISWWTKHLPILISVEGEYSFYAIDLANNKGSIVRGYEPEFEEVEIVADNFIDFLNLIIENTNI